MLKGPSLFPVAASTLAREVDTLSVALLLLCTLILTGVFLAMFYFSVRYWHAMPRPPGENPSGSWKLEIVWTIGPLVASAVFFVWGTSLYLKMHEPPENAWEIYVVGKQWMWKFQHPDGRRELNELHVPVGIPIKLIMTSEDVIHSFFVPAFRLKQDVLPGRSTYAWFNAIRPGSYHLFCTQYCGTSHASMRAQVVVLPQAEFTRWQATGSGAGSPTGGETLAQKGAALFQRLGCISCHATPSFVQAPRLDGLYGSWVGLSDGSRVFADEQYLRESILFPNAKIVQGFQPIMPSFQGQVSEEEVDQLIAYIKTLRVRP
jgi:cytochrome c oxidase subunit 2